MVPFHNPIPDRKQRGKADGASSGDPSQGGVGGGMMSSWIQAEKMIQVAMVLPGFWLDRHFHQTWMAMAGVVFGIIAGLVAAIRMAMVYARDPAMHKLDENGNSADKSGKTGDSSTDS
jgi:F0F1-type ATP synthase assembly protein I